MKIAGLLLMLSVVSVFASKSYSQTKLLNLNLEQTTVKDVLAKIEDQSEFYFMYSGKVIDVEREVSVKAENQKIDAVLDAMFAGTNVDYTIRDRIIVLTTPEIFSSESLVAFQQPTVSGTVTDESGQPLPGVTVVVAGTTTGTVTNGDGEFSLTIPDDAETLQFSFVGMRTQEVAISDRTTLTVVMQEETIGLEEVVAVGYGTQKKVNITGAVDVVSGEKLANRSAPNVSQLIQGTAPNLTITNSFNGGEPGSAPSWNIRGMGSISGNDAPLILVDGVEMNVNNIDPENIESISILKDASASAIYGSRAPFGVVLITTKKGKKGKGFSFQYNNDLALTYPVKLLSFVDSYSLATAFNQATANANGNQKFSDSQVERIKAYQEGTYTHEYDIDRPYGSVFQGRHNGNANYDWVDEMFKDYSFTQKHTLSADGSTDNTQYYISAGYYNQEGAWNWADDKYKRYNFLTNLTSQVTDWLSIDVSTKFARDETDLILGHRINPRQETLEFVTMMWPTQPKYNENGSIQMPLIKIMQDGGREKTKRNDFWLNGGTEIEPVKGWKTRVSYNYNVVSRAKEATPSPVWAEVPNGTLGNIGKNSYGYESDLSQVNYRLFNAITSYENTIKGHYFKGMVGWEEEAYLSTALYGTGDQLITPLVPSISTSLGVTTVDDGKAHWGTQAAFGRLNYNFNEKYLFELSARYNGSSRFAKDSRWGFFPSASAGYNISKENFWAGLESYVNNLKIKGSYGSLGNQNVANYLYLSTVPVNSQLPFLIGGGRPNYAGTPGIKASDLTWETITTLNLGLEAGFLDNRLGLNFDWYDRKTSDMIGPAESLPAALGTSAPKSNNAELSTKGFELTLSWKDRISHDFSYNATLTLGDSKTKILKYKNAQGLIDTWYEGKEVGELWGYVTEGIFQTQEEADDHADQTYIYKRWQPGDMKYKDISGPDGVPDGKVDPGTGTLDDHGDRIRIGNSSPRYNFSITAGFNWKGFDFNMFWAGVGKRDYFPYVDVLFFGMWDQGNQNSSTLMKGTPALDYWRPADETNFLGPNTDAYLAKPYASKETQKNRKGQTRFVQNAAYLRLKNLQIGYTIPPRLSNKLYIQKARIFLSGENLLVLSGLPDAYDPETIFSSNRSYGIGMRRIQTGAIYPLSGSYSIGINVTF